MTVAEMHTDFEFKFNRVNTETSRGLIDDEIDKLLNEGQEVFIKIVAQPKHRSIHGFEINQRTIDDVRPLVIQDLKLKKVANVTDHYNLLKYDDSSNIEKETNYWYYIDGHILIKKGNCINKCVLKIRQHDDEFETNPFEKSSFTWKIVNAVFNSNGLKIYKPNNTSIENVYMSYIKKPKKIDKTNNINCELPEGTHNEIVDIAVAIASNSVNPVLFNSKIQKMQINKLTN